MFPFQGAVAQRSIEILGRTHFEFPAVQWHGSGGANAQLSHLWQCLWLAGRAPIRDPGSNNGKKGCDDSDVAEHLAANGGRFWQEQSHLEFEAPWCSPRVHFRRNTKPNWSWKRLRISLKERGFESGNCRRRWSSKASLLQGHLLQDIMKKQGFSTGDEEESTVARPDRMHQGISALWSISVPSGIGTNTTPLLAPLDRRLQPLHTG